MNNLFKSLSLLAVGGAVGVLVSQFLLPSHETEQRSAGANEPLYWVAPMDANFRRDKPGKSPMGMDLVPVYANDNASEQPSAGTVFIAPHVVNNLGVRSAPVTKAVLENKISTVGYVQYDQERLIHIHPRVEGWINKLHVKTAGEHVTKGQPLYDIYSPTLVNAQEELLLGVNRANKRLVNAAKERLHSLLVPAKTIDRIITRRQVEQTITLYAPQSGVVDNLVAREGFYVKPGTKIMSIGALDEVWVNAQVFERQSSAVNIGDHVSMTLDYWPREQWHGQVDYVYPTLDEQTRTLRVRLRFDNQDRKLKPNMFAKVAIDTNGGQTHILVPRESVIRTGKSSRVVMDLGGGNFKSVKVELGRSNEQFIEVLSGLEEGDSVVVSAQFLIDSESSVSSDFMRINSETEQPVEEVPNTVVVNVMVETVMEGHRMVTLTHPPIPQWGWPEMTMDFMVAKDVDMSLFKQGESLDVEITEDDELGYAVIAVVNQGKEAVDHSQMNHAQPHNH